MACTFHKPIQRALVLAEAGAWDLPEAIQSSEFLQFATDVKIFKVIKSREDYLNMQWELNVLN